MHKHHIIPRHAGGTDDPSNLIELTVEEHAEAHRVLYEEHGREYDRIAWKTLSGQIKNADARILALKESAKGNKWREGKYHTDETKELIRQGGMGNTNKKKGKKANWTEEGMRSLVDYARQNFLTNNPMSNPESVEKVRQSAFNKKPCPHCGQKMNAGNLKRHIASRHQE